MPLQTTGPINFENIRVQFPGSGYPMYFSQFYAGGPFVPAGTTGINGGIPASGPLAMSQFYGAPATPSGLVDFIPYHVSATGSAPAGTWALFQFINQYEQAKSGQGAMGTVGTWLLSGLATDYVVRATLTADNGQALWSGTFGSWLGLGGIALVWQYGNGGVGSHAEATVLFEIALASTLQVLDSGYVTFWSDRV